MRLTLSLLIAFGTLLPLASHAQILITNPPPTEIENFEQQNDVVIVKGYGEIGSVTTGAGAISVQSKESDNTTLNSRMYGIAVTFESGQSRGRLVVDYDELDSLIRSLDYIGKITYDVTPMPAFDASFTTRSGLRISAHTDRRDGGIRFYLQFGDTERIPLSNIQFGDFQNLVYQAKTSLDVTKSKNQGG